QEPRGDQERLRKWPNASRPSLGDPTFWTPKKNHCTTNNQSPHASDCLQALENLPIPHENLNTLENCWLPSNGWKQLQTESGEVYKAKQMELFVEGRAGLCGVGVYDPKGLTHCVVRQDVEDAVHRIIDGCADPIGDHVEGWTDIRHAPGGGRRIVKVYKLQHPVNEHGEPVFYRNERDGDGGHS